MTSTWARAQRRHTTYLSPSSKWPLLVKYRRHSPTLSFNLWSLSCHLLSALSCSLVMLEVCSLHFTQHVSHSLRLPQLDKNLTVLNHESLPEDWSSDYCSAFHHHRWSNGRTPFSLPGNDWATLIIVLSISSNCDPSLPMICWFTTWQWKSGREPHGTSRRKWETEGFILSGSEKWQHKWAEAAIPTTD